MVEDLAAGLPLIVTRGLGGGVVSKLGLGIEVDFDQESLADAIAELLEDEKRLNEMKRNAREFGKSRDWNIIIRRAFEEISMEIIHSSEKLH
jgi:glycosyltransferase involved in cell wall biosynthesis